MKFLSRIILAVIVNGAGLWLASYLFEDFSLNKDPLILLEVAAILTVLNFVLRPILKLLLGPIIILTLGLGIILVNGLMLYLLDILSKDLSIQGIQTLLYSTLLISVLNFVFHISTKSND